MALKRHYPFQIAQAGAALNNVLSWDGTKWVPAALSSIGGTSIYTGSGTIGAGVASSNTHATLPASNSSFDIRYFGGNSAILAQGNGVNSGTLGMVNLAGDFGIHVNDLDMTFLYPVGSMSFESGKITVNDTVMFLDTIGASPDANALLEVSSTTKAFFPPRMTTVQKNAMGAVNDAAIVYDLTQDQLNLRVNGSWVSLQDSNSVITASNGLTKTGSDIALGGTLTQDTVIANASLYKLTLSGVLFADYLLNVNNTVTSGTGSGIKGTTAGTTGIGILGQATGGGTGISGISDTSGVAGVFTTENSTNTTAITGLQVNRNVTSGAGAAGTGVKLGFGLETTTTVSTLSNNIISEWTTATHASRASKLTITSVNNAVEANSLEIAATGALRLNKYGVNTFTGTAAKTLQVDSSGNVIEGSLNPPSGSGGIYGGSGSIPNATVATVSGSGDFTFDYSTGADAIRIVDDANGVIIKSRDASKTLRIQNSDINLASGSLSLKVDSNGLTGVSTPILVDYTGSGPSNNSGLELRATDKVFYPSRLTTTQRDLLTASMLNGGLIYNSTTNKFNLFENSAWVAYMVDTAGVGGIYKGSGTIASAAVATVTASSTFKIAYSTGGNGAITVSSTSGSENVVIGGQASGYGRLSVTNSQATLLAGASGQGITVAEGLSIFTSNSHQIGKKVLFTAVNTPATFGTDRNDYNIGDNTHIRVETTVDNTQITGMTHGFGLGNFGDAEGRIVYLTNIGATNNIRIAGNNAGSQSEYRFITLITLAPGQTIQFIYDATSQRWRNVT